MGFARIPYGEISAWAALTGRDPMPSEVALIVALDRAYGAWVAGQQAVPEQPGMVRMDDPDGIARLFEELG